MNNTIKVSGTETNYRMKKCFQFQYNLNKYKQNYKFKFNSKITFDTNNNYFGFAYQPAQSRHWEKSNPIKIWRDAWIHKAIPIVDKKFNDHIIENLAITTDNFFKESFKQNEYLENQDLYIKQSKKLNKKLFKKIKEFKKLNLNFKI